MPLALNIRVWVGDDTEGTTSKVSRGARTHCTCVNGGESTDLEVNGR
jgi:hypothetical protein